VDSAVVSVTTVEGVAVAAVAVDGMIAGVAVVAATMVAKRNGFP